MTKRILIIGGYGNFGSYIARSLAHEPNIHLLIGGRSLDKARAFISQLSASNAAEPMVVDIGSDLSPVLRAARPDIVVHTTGPFQRQGYTVAESCLREGCHYVDLADARDFVVNIGRYDQAAKEKKLLVVSGASSVPCLTAAVVDYYRPRFRSLERIEYGISASQQTNRGLATVSAILSYVGKPFLTLIEGRRTPVYGWQNLHGIRYPELGWRWFGNCDIPDLDLFPKRYPELKTVRFAAGHELRAVHLGLWFLSWPVRLRLISSLEKYGTLLLKSSFLFDALATGKSGFHMFLSGIDLDGQPRTERFYIIARSGHGPYIPCMPAILLAKGLADGSVRETGARPCLDLIDWPAYRAALKELDISVLQNAENE